MTPKKGSHHKKKPESSENYRQAAYRRWNTPGFKAKFKSIMLPVWESEEWRKAISNALTNNPKMKYRRGRTWIEILGLEKTKKLKELWSLRMTENNIVHRPGAAEKMGKSKIEFYKKNPEKHPNFILSGCHGSKVISKPQLEMLRLLVQLYPDARLNYPIVVERGTRFADVAVPSSRLVFEYNEPYWHQNPKADLKRILELEQANWKVLTFNKLVEVKEYVNSHQ